MNKLKNSLAAKLIAVTLFVLLLMSLAASVLDIAYIDSIDGYNYDYQTLLHKFKYDNSNDLRAVMYALGNGDSPADLNGRNGFYFVIRDYYTREVVFDGLGKRDHVWVSGPVSFEVPAEYAIPMPEAAADAGAGSGYGDSPRTDGTGKARADQEDAEGPRRCVPLGHDDRGAARRDGRKGRGDLLHSPEGIGSHGLRAEAVRAQ